MVLVVYYLTGIGAVHIRRTDIHVSVKMSCLANQQEACISRAACSPVTGWFEHPCRWLHHAAARAAGTLCGMSDRGRVSFVLSFCPALMCPPGFSAIPKESGGLVEERKVS